MFTAIAVTKRFGNLTAIDQVDLQTEAAKTTVLLGPSGCGKSTLLRLLLGTLQPDSGEVLFDGQSWKAETSVGMRRQIGFVPQDGALFPHFTASQNIRLPALSAGMSKPDMAKRVEELRELVRLPRELLDRYPNELSGGQRGRVALARAMMMDPSAIVMDEPMSALDPLVRYELQQDLRKIFDQLQKTVLLVTHDLQEAARLANHVVLLRAGQIVQQGTFQEFLEAPASPYVKTFFDAQKLSAFDQKEEHA